MSEDYQDSLRTDRFYDRPTVEVTADLDAEEAELTEDLWATEWALEDEAERLADEARDEMAAEWWGGDAA